MTFNDFNLAPFLLNSLNRMNITSPTPIQASALPIALTGADILASAQTGTGKTMAYLLPLLTLIQKGATALILTPTRELAIQVSQEIKKLDDKRWIVTLIGGNPMARQLADLRRNPSIIIGTPGRVNDHLKRKSLKLDRAAFLVLDETDRMLDMGFTEVLEKIVSYMPQQRQTLMFSATIPNNISKLSDKYLNNPQMIKIGATTKPASQIKQETIQLNANDKFTQLVTELTHREGSIIVFVKTKIDADKLAARLDEKEFKADAMHGDLPQHKRERVIRNFSSGKRDILVATDLAARGLDMNVMHVINFDLPQCAEDYIHRIGRTGRAGAVGHAISFVSPVDKKRWNAIAKLMAGDSYEESSSGSNSNKRDNDRSSRSSRFNKSKRFDRPSRFDDSNGQDRSSRFSNSRKSDRSDRLLRANSADKRERSDRFNDPNRSSRTSSKFDNNNSKPNNFERKSSFKPRANFSNKKRNDIAA